jgi:hypothetical protein
VICARATGRVIRIAAPVIVAALAAMLLVSVLPGGPALAAASHTCGSNWCSGTDSNNGTKNIEGNNPQIYTGEVGHYYTDFGCGSGGPAFDTTAANNAMSRWNAGTGMGVWFYYFVGGYTSTCNNAPSAYCWGWDQGYEASYHAAHSYSDYIPSAYVMMMDIESPSDYGWSDMYQAQNREVFDGFTDEVADRTSKDSRCTSHYSDDIYQYGIYSDNSDFSYALGSSTTYTGTLKWTYQYYCYTTYPQSFVDAEWFGGSDNNDEWQYLHDCSAAGNNDYDVLYEPVYLPALGFSIGS